MKEKEKYVAQPQRTITFSDLTEEEKKEIAAPSHPYRYTSIEETSPDDNPVDHPSHYQSMSSKCDIECMDAMRAAFGDYEVAIFCRINAMKYVWRSDSKGGNQDIEKAIWYLKKFLELGGCDQ